ncbi:MAG TPA: hypothetical protein VFO41_05465 [Alphaproteobacteria bacterium]|nr:hypothetical protein [Alphaproteobacteria bacterium]
MNGCHDAGTIEIRPRTRAGWAPAVRKWLKNAFRPAKPVLRTGDLSDYMLRDVGLTDHVAQGRRSRRD